MNEDQVASLLGESEKKVRSEVAALAREVKGVLQSFDEQLKELRGRVDTLQDEYAKKAQSRSVAHGQRLAKLQEKTDGVERDMARIRQFVEQRVPRQ
jgi:DNA anti-recombination protein RmuC